MTTFNSAYNTTAYEGSDNMLHKINKELELLSINSNINSSKVYPSIDCLVGREDAAHIPAFSHPVCFKEKVVIDLRPFTTFDKEQYTYVVKNKPEHDLLTMRGGLQQLWTTTPKNYFRDVSTMCVSVYASLISESIARRYSLDPKEQMDLLILSAIFYCGLFNDEEELTEDLKLKYNSYINKSIKVNNKDTLEILDKIKPMRGMKDFCSMAKELTGSIRLNDFNIGVLYTIINSSWFGTNARDTVAVALEHPPTWIAIIYSAITDRSYKNSFITKIVDRSSYNQNRAGYTMATNALLKQLVEE